MPQQRSTDHFELKPAQQRVLGVLKSEGPPVSRAPGTKSLWRRALAGRVRPRRAGRDRHPRTGRSRPGDALPTGRVRGQDDRRRWTNERIRSALQEFCAEREAWPSAREFKKAGHHDLYVAASRYGGVAFWAKELGSHARAAAGAARGRPRRGRPATAAVDRRCGRGLALAPAGAGQPACTRRRGRGRATTAAGRDLKPPAVHSPRVTCRSRRSGPPPGPRRLRTRDATSWPRYSRARRADRAGAYLHVSATSRRQLPDELVEPRAPPRAFRRQRPRPTAPATREVTKEATCVAARCRHRSNHL